MIDILNGYLILHKNISIPGLGTIYLEDLPSTYDIANKRMLPPAFKFRFDKYFDAPDKEFFSFLANHQNIPEYEAIKQYNEFAYELRNRIRKEEVFHWQGVGDLSRDVTGDINFISKAFSPWTYKPVEAIRVIRQDVSHALLVGDRERTMHDMSEYLHEEVFVEKESWWIYALILFAIALSMLFFHFYHYGWRFESIGGK